MTMLHAIGPHDYYDGVNHRLNVEIARMASAWPGSIQQLAELTNMSASKFSRHINGQRPWNINDLDALLRVLGATTQEHERVLSVRRAMAGMDRMTRPYAGLLSRNQCIFWEAAATAPLIYIQSGLLLPFPVRSLNYQMSVDQLLDRNPLAASKQRELMRVVIATMLTNGNRVHMLMQNSALEDSQISHPENMQDAPHSPRWSLRAVEGSQQFHQAMLHTFIVMIWPEDPEQDLLFINDEDFEPALTRDWKLVARYRSYFEDCWNSVA